MLLVIWNFSTGELNEKRGVGGCKVALVLYIAIMCCSIDTYCNYGVSVVKYRTDCYHDVTHR